MDDAHKVDVQPMNDIFTTMLGELRQILGFAGCHRKYIPDLS